MKTIFRSIMAILTAVAVLASCNKEVEVVKYICRFLVLALLEVLVCCLIFEVNIVALHYGIVIAGTRKLQKCNCQQYNYAIYSHLPAL